MNEHKFPGGTKTLCLAYIFTQYYAESKRLDRFVNYAQHICSRTCKKVNFNFKIQTARTNILKSPIQATCSNYNAICDVIDINSLSKHIINAVCNN